MKTYSLKLADIKSRWYLVDADDKPLGILASKISRYLRGKHKPEYTPHLDMGDYIVVVNAGKVAISGNKMKQKIYYRHTGYPGGIKSTSFEEMLDKKPEMIIEKAVKGMLPKGPLGRSMFRKLHVYPSAEHRHVAQRPEFVEI